MAVTERQFYDHLYEVVTFRAKYWDSPSTEEFQGVIQTHEFNRLNFIKQEGFTWLQFPASTHTRFSAALGCWHLADFAVDHIPVIGEKSRQRLGDFLGEWIEEFRLAVLLHDVGHFPFTLTVETNDWLKKQFAGRGDPRYHQEIETRGIELVHEDFAASLVCNEQNVERLLKAGSNQRRIYVLYEQFKRWYKKEHALSDDPSSLKDQKFIANLLTGLKNVDVGKLIFLLDPSRDDEDDIAFDGLPIQFVRQLRQLVVGTVDLGHLDRYARISHCVLGRAGDLPVREFINQLSLERLDDGEFQIRLTEQGVNYAFQILYLMKNVLTRNVLHNVNRLAYETMLNHAINEHWKDGSEKEFRQFLPFFDDDELLQRLSRSSNLEVKRTIERIRQRRPYHCLGCFQLKAETYQRLGKAPRPPENDRNSVDLDAKSAAKPPKLDTVVSIKTRRREAVLDYFHDNLAECCMVRLTKSFGTPNREEKQQLAEVCVVKPTWANRAEWMDLDEVYAVVEDVEHREQVRKLSELEEHKESVNLIMNETDKLQRTFWLFTSETDEAKQKEQGKTARKLFRKFNSPTGN